MGNKLLAYIPITPLFHLFKNYNTPNLFFLLYSFNKISNKSYNGLNGMGPMSLLIKFNCLIFLDFHKLQVFDYLLYV